MAPDAVVGLIKRTDEIGAAVGQREAFAPAQMGGVEAAMGPVVLFVQRHQVQRVEFGRCLEQDASRMAASAGIGMGGPRGVRGCQLQFLCVCRFLGQPGGHQLRETEFREPALHPGRELRLEGRAVDGLRFGGFDLGHRAALHEGTLDRVQRGQLCMAGSQCLDLRFDPEQMRDECLDVRGECDQQLRRF